jgi:transcriptional antiterminator NusG
MYDPQTKEEERKKPNWYALRTFTGHEQKVKNLIEIESKRLGIDERILEVVIPEETVFEVRGGKRRTKTRNFLPGYIILHAVLDLKVQDVVQNLPSVVSFVGRRNEATPLRKDEVDRIIGRLEERKDVATVETQFEIGDPIKVIDGPFNTFSGTVKEVNNEKQKLKVEVGILGRKTPVELDFTQVEIENPSDNNN